MSDENKQVALNSDHGAVSLNMGFMVATTLDEAIKIAGIIAKSKICPENLKDKPGDVLVAMQLGAEVGLKPLAAIQNIAVINGRPSIWGDAMLAICRQSKQFEYITERYDEAKVMYTCIVKRHNEPEFISTFSKEDAKLANLWNKQGAWTQYPKRMLQMRARGFALRDSFPDLLRGIITSEEAEDYPSEKRDHSRSVGEIVEGERVETINAEQLEILKDRLAKANRDVENACKYYELEKLEDMTVSTYSGLIKSLETAISRQAKSNIMRELVANKSTPEITQDELDTFQAELGEVNMETGEVS
jgi:hypothetical protein